MAFDTLSHQVGSNVPPPPVQPINPKFLPLDSESDPSRIGTHIPPPTMICDQPTADYPNLKFPPLDLSITGMMDSGRSVCVLWAFYD